MIEVATEERSPLPVGSLVLSASLVQSNTRSSEETAQQFLRWPRAEWTWLIQGHLLCLFTSFTGPSSMPGSPELTIYQTSPASHTGTSLWKVHEASWWRALPPTFSTSPPWLTPAEAWKSHPAAPTEPSSPTNHSCAHLQLPSFLSHYW